MKDWLKEFAGLEKKQREGGGGSKGYLNYTLAEAIPHFERDMDWLLESLSNDPYAQMQLRRIRFHIIGVVAREKALAIFRHSSNHWFKKRLE